MTAKHRLDVYSKLVEFFIGDERITTEIKLSNGLVYFMYSDTLCHALKILDITGRALFKSLSRYPEISDQDPGSVFWFPSVKKGPDHNRLNVIFKAIKKISENESISTEDYKNAIDPFASQYLAWYNGTNQ